MLSLGLRTETTLCCVGISDSIIWMMVAMFWILACVLDGIEFKWPFDVARISNPNNVGLSFKPRAFTVDDIKLASDGLYMIKIIRLVYVAEEAFVYMIDGQRDLLEAMKFPTQYETSAATADTCKAYDNSFSTQLYVSRVYLFYPRNGR